MSIDKMRKRNAIFTDNFKKNIKLYHDLVENGQHPKVLWVAAPIRELFQNLL